MIHSKRAQLGIWIARLVIVSLIIVEILGGLKLLGFQTEFTWKGLILQSTVASAGLEFLVYLIRRNKLPYSLQAGALIFAFVLAADAIGDLAYFYGRFSSYDQWMHFFGGFAVVFIATGLIQAVHTVKRKNQIHKAEIFLYGLAVGTLGSVFYEIEEYLEDILTGSNRLGDGFDTANDLALGILGGILAAILILKFPKLSISRKSN